MRVHLKKKYVRLKKEIEMVESVQWSTLVWHFAGYTLKYFQKVLSSEHCKDCSRHSAPKVSKSEMSNLQGPLGKISVTRSQPVIFSGAFTWKYHCNSTENFNRIYEKNIIWIFLNMTMILPLLILCITGNKIPYENLQVVLKKRFTLSLICQGPYV